MREDFRIYVENVLENINNLSGTGLTNYLIDLFKTIGDTGSIELDGENKLDISNVDEQLEFFEEVYNNIQRESDKEIFISELTQSNLYPKIINNFKAKMPTPPENAATPEPEAQEPEMENAAGTTSTDSEADYEPTEEQQMEVETRTIKMQYPNQADYPDLRAQELWDGQSHEITATSNNFFEFNLGEEKYYLMRYMDNNVQAATLLKLNENNEIVNVPLDDYEIANELLSNINGVRYADINILPEEIKLGSIEKTSDLIAKAKGQAPKTTGEGPDMQKEGPAITEYKAETERLEKELEELNAKIDGLRTPSGYPIDSSKDEPDYTKAIETLKNSIQENNEIRVRLNSEPYKMKLKIVEPSEDLVRAMDEATRVNILDNQIKTLETELEGINKNIEALDEQIQQFKHKDNSDAMRYPLVRDKFLREKERDQKLKELKEAKAKKEIAKKSSTYLDATKIREIILQEIVYSNETQNAIAAFRNKLESRKEPVPYELQLNGEGNYPDRLNTIINNLFEAQKGFENKEKEINVNNQGALEKASLMEEAEKLKAEIEKRKENIAKYYDVLKDIKDIENDIKSGKNPEDLKDKIDNVNNKINSINDDKLKEELKEELNKALTKKKEPIQPGPVTKNPRKWHVWMGALGLAVGAGIVALTPLTGIGGGLAVAIGAQIVKKAANAYHKHVLKPPKKLPKENEVTDIKKPSKLAQFHEKIKEWFRDETHMKNINWFLNGTSIGAVAMGLYEGMTGINFGEIEPTPIENTVSNNDIGGVTNDVNTPTTPNVKVGDSTSGMDLTTGYDRSNWAINGNNPEALNQGIMNDGNSVVRNIMDAQGNTYMTTEEAIQAGKSLNELTFDVANGLDVSSIPRAWVNADSAMKTL